MTLTRAQIRAELYNRLPGLGFVGTADSLSSTSLIDTFNFQDSLLTSNYYRGSYLYRPALTDDDRVKKISQVATSTGTITLSGSAYGDTSTLGYELIGPMHPDELNACIRRALQRVYFDVQVVLPGLVTDGDMDASDATSWTNSGLSSMAKDTTNVFSGIRSLKCLANSNDDLAISNGFRVSEQTNFYVSAVVRVEVGQPSLIVYDQTNSAAIVTISPESLSVSSTATPGEWLHLWAVGTFPDGCVEAKIRLSHTDATVAYWDHVALYPMDSTMFTAPSWLNEQFKFLKLREARYDRTVSHSNSVGGVNIATSRKWHDWIQPSMFSLDPLHVDDNPYVVNLMRPVPQNELWVQAKRPYSDLEDLDDESDTTHAPPRLIYAYASEEVLKALVARYPQEQRWATLYNNAREEVIAESQARPEIPLSPIRREVMGRV